MKLLGRVGKALVLLGIVGLMGWGVYPYIVPYINSEDSANSEETPQISYQPDKYMALGETLSETDRQDTIDLLKGENISGEDIIYVDGPMVDEYLNDGSTANTRVFSSVSIEMREEGSGIQVDIVTPDKITGVSNLTYHNAAINSGATDMYIRIATLHEVDGSGALVGLYALLNQLGVGDKLDYKNTNTQLELIQLIEEETGEPNERINQFFIDLRRLIIEMKQTDDEFGEQQAKDILDKLLRVYNFELSDNLYQQLIVFMINFSHSDLIEDPNFEQELDNVNIEQPNYNTFTTMDIDFSQDWYEVLTSLAESGWNISLAELKNEASNVLAQSNNYHPIIAAMYEKFIGVTEAQLDFMTLEASGDIYSHTFLLEEQLELTDQEQGAVNYLRFLIYLYDHHFAQSDDTFPPSTVKELWLDSLNNKDALLSDSVQQRNALLAIAEAIGQAIESSTYHRINYSEDGNKLIVSYNYAAARMSASPFDFTYDFNTQEVGEYMNMSGEFRGLADERHFSFESEYGVSLVETVITEEEPKENKEQYIDSGGVISREDMLQIIIDGDLNNNAETEGELLIGEMEGLVSFHFTDYGEWNYDSIAYIASDREKLLGIQLDDESKVLFDKYLYQLWDQHVSDVYAEINTAEHYKPLVYRYIDSLKSYGDLDNIIQYDTVSSFVLYQLKASDANSLDYVEIDVNNDGTNELLFRYGGKIFEVFTYSQNEVVALFNDETLAERSHLAIYPDGTMVVHASGGAMTGAYTKYSFGQHANQLIEETTVHYDLESMPAAYYIEGTSEYMTEAEFVDYMGFNSLSKFVFDYNDQIDISPETWNTLY